jgi:hypothetical protein
MSIMVAFAAGVLANAAPPVDVDVIRLRSDLSAIENSLAVGGDKEKALMLFPLKSSASPLDRKRWESLLLWAQERTRESTERVRGGMSARVGGLLREIPSGCYGNLTCEWILDADKTVQNLDAPGVMSSAREALTAYSGLSGALAGIDSIAPKSSLSPAQLLTRNLYIDQAVRGCFMPGDAYSGFSLTGRNVFKFLCRATGRRLDVEAREDLKGLIQRNGWPSVKASGQDGYLAAFTVIQHADSDPVFQATALEIMQRQVDDGDIPAKYYAYLYDRLHLKFAGAQRYGTQVECRGGKMQASRVDMPLRLDELRAKAGLEPLSAYLLHFPASC